MSNSQERKNLINSNNYWKKSGINEIDLFIMGSMDFLA